VLRSQYVLFCECPNPEAIVLTWFSNCPNFEPNAVNLSLSSAGRTGDGHADQGRAVSSTRTRVFEAGESCSARRSLRYRHIDGPRVGATGGRRRTGVQFELADGSVLTPKPLS